MRKESLKIDGKTGTGEEKEMDMDDVVCVGDDDTDLPVIDEEKDPLDVLFESVKANGDNGISAPKKGRKKGKVSINVPPKSDDEEDAASGVKEPEPKEEEDYEVEQIVGAKMVGKQQMFLVRWKNYGPESDTWEPKKMLSCPELIEKYLTENKTEEKPVKAKKAAAAKKVKKAPTTPTKKAPKRGASTAAGSKTPAKREKIVAAQEPDYEVKEIIDEKMERGRKFFLIRWKNYTADDDTWEPEDGLNCPDIIKAFQVNRANKSKSSKKGGGGTKSSASKKKQSAQNGDDENYEVEAIVDDKVERGKTYYLIRWVGWSAANNTWEPESSLSCPDIIKRYKAEQSKSRKSSPVKPKKGAAATKSVAAKTKSKSTPKKSSGGKQTKGAKKQLIESDDENEDEDNDEEEWEVQEIMDVKYTDSGAKEYLIRWKGCKPTADTWEPESNLDCADLIKKFHQKSSGGASKSKKKSRK